jgi:hypothetical protein
MIAKKILDSYVQYIREQLADLDYVYVYFDRVYATPDKS